MLLVWIVGLRLCLSNILCPKIEGMVEGGTAAGDF